MFQLYLVTLLAATAFSLDIPCKEGVEIKTQPIKSADYVAGNWSYMYHWQANETSAEIALKSLMYEFLSSDCLKVQLPLVTPDYVKKVQDKCGKDMSLNWEDAKLGYIIPDQDLVKDMVIFMGEKGDWLSLNCIKPTQIEFRKVYDDIIVMVYVEENMVDLLSRKTLTESELLCLVHNVDVAKGMDGIPFCY